MTTGFDKSPNRPYPKKGGTLSKTWAANYFSPQASNRSRGYLRGNHALRGTTNAGNAFMTDIILSGGIAPVNTPLSQIVKFEVAL